MTLGRDFVVTAAAATATTPFAGHIDMTTYHEPVTAESPGVG